MSRLFLLLFLLVIKIAAAQPLPDDSVDARRWKQLINLKEVVLDSKLDVTRFINQVKNDTTFYKAFRNLRVLEFTSSNDILLKDKKANPLARLVSKTRQHRVGNCRNTEVLQEKVQGNFYERDGAYAYYTAALYSSLFFAKGTVCGENNIVAGKNFAIQTSKGIAKHKEQLKLLLFNPGKKIPGIPFVGDKVDVFDAQRSKLYNYEIDYVNYRGEPCYLFSIEAKPNLFPSQRDKLVVDRMTTWFSVRTMEVLARHYTMSYNAGFYDFSVEIEADLMRYKNWVVPATLRYVGNWDVPFKERERGVFTATLYDFND
jgi:hypothetical protein